MIGCIVLLLAVAVGWGLVGLAAAVPDPVKQLSVTYGGLDDDSVTLSWLKGDPQDADQEYVVERWNGETWEELTTTTDLNATDPNPLKHLDEVRYRVVSQELGNSTARNYGITPHQGCGSYARYTFDGTLAGSGTHNPMLTHGGTPEYADAEYGVVSGQALDLTTRFSLSGYTIGINRPSTFSLWLSPQSDSFTGNIAGVGSLTSKPHIKITQSVNGNINIRAEFGASSNTHWVITFTKATIGSWYHIVVTNEGSGNANGQKIYIDGVLRSTGSNKRIGNAGGVSSTGPYLGASGSSVPYLVDDLLLCSRELTPEEVKRLYEMGIAKRFAPDPITLLQVPQITATSALLQWDASEPYDAPAVTYQLNYTTPHGEPSTVLRDSETGTSYSISDLAPDTDYSFRVSATTDYGTSRENAITNIRTAIDLTRDSSPRDANPDRLDIRFERADVSETETVIRVDYAAGLTLVCDMDYRFGGQSRTYDNLTRQDIGEGRARTEFVFTNYTNDIVAMHCYDVRNPEGGQRYEVAWSSFPLLQQIQDFRGGAYGTQGLIGTLDVVALGAVLVSMVGFNRWNAAVGAFFCATVLGVLAYFEVVSIPGAIFGALAVVIMLAIVSTRKEG